MYSDLRIICPQITSIVLVFSKNMTRFKNYSYLMVDRKVLKRCIVGIENSCLLLGFCIVYHRKITKYLIFFGVYL